MLVEKILSLVRAERQFAKSNRGLCEAVLNVVDMIFHGYHYVSNILANFYQRSFFLLMEEHSCKFVRHLSFAVHVIGA